MEADLFGWLLIYSFGGTGAIANVLGLVLGAVMILAGWQWIFYLVSLKLPLLPPVESFPDSLDLYRSPSSPYLAPYSPPS